MLLNLQSTMVRILFISCEGKSVVCYEHQECAGCNNDRALLNMNICFLFSYEPNGSVSVPHF